MDKGRTLCHLTLHQKLYYPSTILQALALFGTVLVALTLQLSTTGNHWFTQNSDYCYYDHDCGNHELRESLM